MKTATIHSQDSGSSTIEKCYRKISYKEALTGQLESEAVKNLKYPLHRDSVSVTRASNPHPTDISPSSSSTPSVPSSPSPPIRPGWWPGQDRCPGSGWQNQNHFPPRTVSSAPPGDPGAGAGTHWRRHSHNHRFYDSSSQLFQHNSFSRKVFSRPRIYRGETKSRDTRHKHPPVKSPTPIVSIEAAFKREAEKSRNPRKDKVQRFICFPTCAGQRESTVHFFPDLFSMPSYSYDMIFYQKLAMVLGTKGKRRFFRKLRKFKVLVFFHF